MIHLKKVASAVILLAVLGATSAAGAVSAVATTVTVADEKTESRQLLGIVTGVTDFEVSAHNAGAYAVEYEVADVSFWNTYINGLELGYVGGSTGVYRTRSVTLTAGDHLVRVTGPEGHGRQRCTWSSSSGPCGDLHVVNSHFGLTHEHGRRDDDQSAPPSGIVPPC